MYHAIIILHFNRIYIGLTDFAVVMSQHYFGHRTSNMNASVQSGCRSLGSNMNPGRNGSARNVLNRSGSVQNVIGTVPILERNSSMRNMRSLPGDRRRNSSAVAGSSRRFLVPPEQPRNSATNSMSLGAHFARANLERSNSTSSIASVCGGSTRSLGESGSDPSMFSLSSLSMATRTLQSMDDSTISGMESMFSRDSVSVRQRQMEISANSDVQNDDLQSIASSECTIYSFDRRPKPIRLF